MSSGFTVSGNVPETDHQSSLASSRLVCGKSLIRDFWAIFVWVISTDLLLYRYGTYLAWAIATLFAVGYLWLFRTSHHRGGWSIFVAGICAILAAKLMWCGSGPAVFWSVVSVIMFSMAKSGLVPFFPELFQFLVNAAKGAVVRIFSYRLASSVSADGKLRPIIVASTWLPAVAVLVFSTLFLFANPDLLKQTQAQLQIWFDRLVEYMTFVAPGEFLFVATSAFVGLGLMYPAITRMLDEIKRYNEEITPIQSLHYATCRNTLISLSILYVIYLAFEFATLWFRQLPQNFYYAGYAHEGAFWLTVALALATVVISSIFRGDRMHDIKLPLLKRYGLLWSSLNGLLVLAVFNRLFIYINYNGMTRMRVVGLLGITCVAVGLLLVILKIWRDRNFVWLLHRQLWVPVAAAVLYAAFPIDWLVNRANVKRVLNGHDASSVQLVAHTTSAEGLLPMFELLDHQDAKIRDGVRAILAGAAVNLGVVAPPSNNQDPHDPTKQTAEYAGDFQPSGGHRSPYLLLRRTEQSLQSSAQRKWYHWQGAESLLRTKLAATSAKWTDYANDANARSKAIDDFFEYSYQWY